MRDHVRARLLLVILSLAAASAIGRTVRAEQAGHGIVIDQTGLALPGATVQLMRGADVVTTLTTAAGFHSAAGWSTTR